MSGPLGSSQWMYASGEDYTIDQSLRFNDNDSAYLSKTFASSGNTKKWTYSCWYKRGDLDGESHTLFSTARGATNDFDYIRVQTDDSVYVAVRDNSSNYILRLITNRKLRDPSAWYHILVKFDSTASTPSSTDCALYINGVRETDLAAEVLPSQNDTTRFNSNVEHHIGQWNSESSFYLDGHLAEVNFLDGVVGAPADFGETGTYGEWKPIEYKGSYGTNGFYLNFAGGGVMSATGGNSTATDGDYKVASFTSNGTFTPSADGYVEYLVIGGGGAGAADGSTTAGNGGGGAGGYRTGMLAVTASTAYSITVGAGGSGALSANQVSGSDSVFSSITSAGGGGGGWYTSTPGAAGGSGGGGAPPSASGGAGTSGQGNNGEAGSSNQGGGGGGAAEAGGTDGTGQGGDGLASSITGSSVTRAGGGGGSRASGGARAGGDGGGGAGGNGGAGGDGTSNTGSGGGGGVSGGASGSGGSGIVIIRYKFQ